MWRRRQLGGFCPPQQKLIFARKSVISANLHTAVTFIGMIIVDSKAASDVKLSLLSSQIEDLNHQQRSLLPLNKQLEVIGLNPNRTHFRI